MKLLLRFFSLKLIWLLMPAALICFVLILLGFIAMHWSFYLLFGAAILEYLVTGFLLFIVTFLVAMNERNIRRIQAKEIRVGFYLIVTTFLWFLALIRMSIQQKDWKMLFLPVYL